MISVIVAGNTIDVEGIAALVAHDGLGAPPLHEITRRGPMQHGESLVDYRLDARKIQMVFRLNKSSLSGMYTARRTLLNLLAPQNVLSLRFGMDYGNRQINGRALPSLMPWLVGDWAAQKITVTIYCPDPLFYDPVAKSITILSGGGAAAFNVPMPVPHAVGTTLINQSQVVTYVGTWPAYPQLIRITGPIANCVILNTLNGMKLDFTGTTIAAGHYYDINLLYGYKTVLLDGITNKVGDLTSDSDLSTWRLDAATDGTASVDNPIQITGSGVSGATKLDMTWFDRYLGL